MKDRSFPTRSVATTLTVQPAPHQTESRTVAVSDPKATHEALPDACELSIESVQSANPEPVSLTSAAIVRFDPDHVRFVIVIAGCVRSIAVVAFAMLVCPTSSVP